MTSDVIDAGSLAGTWVAAGLALIGVFAILGPFLLWTASRTERHKALMSIGPENNGYLTAGVRLWSGVRFLQMERAPLLASARPIQDKEWQDFDLARVKQFPKSEANWTQYGACLEAYGVRLTRGRALVLRGETLKLPVNKLYLTTFLVTGRYQRGKPSTLMSGKQGTAAAISLPIQSQDRAQNSTTTVVLHGLTGSMTFDTALHDRSYTNVPNGKVKYAAEPPSRLEKDGIDVTATLLLALGVIVLPSGMHLCMADNVETGRNAATIVTDVNQMRRDLSHLTSRMSSRETKFARVQQEARLQLEIHVYELVRIPANTLKLPWANTPVQGEAMALRSKTRSASEQAHLQELATKTYVPAQEEYVRVVFKQEAPSTDNFGITMPLSLPMASIPYEGSNLHCAFMMRRSAQIFAMALLSLPWSQKGYVFGNREGSRLMFDLLLQAAHAAARFLLRLKDHPAILDLTQADTARLIAAVDKALQSDFRTADLCDLDDIFVDNAVRFSGGALDTWRATAHEHGILRHRPAICASCQELHHEYAEQ
ncbi:unnamed protein product [Zymoseptoria tritici ST99CH_3D7]|uniref:Uncharacterized protein n=1 Tax=Zymoseptoria tritici (strain ST99CH_3D7) TaxID=1276538 RepID=A0A1X7S2S0_ZYMT9|nr:unnamed protein product [Zymoseptoria tritici ST99CH_3D7]